MKFFKKLLLFILIAVAIVSGVIFMNGYNLYKNATSKVSLSDKISQIRKKKDFVSKNDLPDFYPKAVVAVEDHRFYNHKTIDLISVGRAVVSNIKQQDFKEGGSSLTQQTAKNLYFISEEDVVSRKIAEILVGMDLEKTYSKDDILEIYYNTIYFGNGYYGIKQACNGYLNKETKDMTLSDATMLAGIPNAPSIYAPTVNPDLTVSRQKWVIHSMVKYNFITQKEADSITLYKK